MRIYINQVGGLCQLCVETDDDKEMEAVKNHAQEKKSLPVTVSEETLDQRFFKHHLEIDVSHFKPKDIFELIQSLDSVII